MGRDPNFWRWNIVRSVIIVFGEPVDVVVVDVQYAGDVADASPTRTNGPEQGPPRKMRKPCCLGNVLGMGMEMAKEGEKYYCLTSSGMADFCPLL